MDIVKLRLIVWDPTMKNKTRERLSMFHMPWNYIEKEELLYLT